MKYYSIHEFSKLISRTPQTLRNWDLSGKLKPRHTGANGYRDYLDNAEKWRTRISWRFNSNCNSV